MYKKYISYFFATFLLTVTCIMSVNFIIDPFKRYGNNMHLFYTQGFSEYKNPGIVRNYPFDSVLVGSSVTENFLISQINRALKMNCIKLSEASATSFEIYNILKFAFDEKRLLGGISNILIGLDIFAFVGERTYIRNNKKFPLYMYDRGLIGDFKYLLNLDVFTAQNALALMYYFLKRKDRIDFDKLYSWHSDTKFDKNVLISNFLNSAKPENLRFEILKRNFDFNLLSLIKQHKDTKFIIFYPPYSILYFKAYLDAGNLDDIIKFKEYVFEVTSIFPNVEIYDFQIDSSITFDLADYKDTIHYSYRKNQDMVDKISKGLFRVTKQNYKQNSTILREQAQNFELNLNN